METQRLIGEVAKRHQVLLEERDPIFVMVTLHELLIAEHAQRVVAVVEHAQQQTAIASAQQLDAAKKTASQIVTGSGTWAADQVTAAGQAVKADIERLLREVREQRVLAERASAASGAERRRAWWAALISAGLVCVAGGLVLGVLLARH